MKLTLSARPLNAEEKKQFGVFVSHSNDSGAYKEVCSAFERAGIPYLVDAQIEIGALNFADEIKRLIDKSKCAVIVVTEGALSSAWVNYEAGLLAGEGKSVYLFDADQLLKKRTARYHMDQFPVFDDTAKLVAAVAATAYFSDLFRHDTSALSKQIFEERARQFTVPVKLTLTLPGLNKLGLENYHFTALVNHFGSYCGKYGDDGRCFQTLDDASVCPGEACALNRTPDTATHPECVVLNKVLDKAIVEGDEIAFVIPLHRLYGTSFKIFAEVSDSKQCDQLIALLTECGADPSYAKSGNLGRIYVSLPDSAWEGVFKLKDTFSNNFLCPGILDV